MSARSRVLNGKAGRGRAHLDMGVIASTVSRSMGLGGAGWVWRSLSEPFRFDPSTVPPCDGWRCLYFVVFSILSGWSTDILPPAIGFPRIRTEFVPCCPDFYFPLVLCSSEWFTWGFFPFVPIIRLMTYLYPTSSNFLRAPSAAGFVRVWLIFFP